MKALRPVLAVAICFCLFSFSGTMPPHKTIRKGVKAQLCQDCGFGNKKDNCAKCNKWMGNTKITAQLCSDCGSGNKKDNCCKCGKWVASNGVPANLCNDCGFGNKKDNCVKCNKWVGS